MSKRRFGSPSDVHLRTAAQAIRESVQHSRRAFKLARQGNCSRALDALSNAENTLGEARAHENSVSLPKFSTAYNKAGTIKVKAGVAFRRSCMKR